MSRFGDRTGGDLRRFAGFAAVGLSGLVVNQFCLWLFTSQFGVHYLWSAVLATQVSTVWNFSLVERYVFHGGARRRLARFGWFALMNNAWLVVRAPALVLLTDGAGINYLWSNGLVLGAMTLVRFAISDRLIWSDPTREGSAGRDDGDAFSHAYDIHGVVRIASQAPLPELARFLVPELDGDPDLEVRIGNDGFGGLRRRTTVDVGEDSVSYVEHLGRHGFAMRVQMGTPIRVQASKLLRRSPHVLYTNAIEPILRWTVVRKGQILAHAACLQIDGHGVLITARTDTGKTTTCLKSIKEHASGFVSDDMVIIGPDGSALSFPKPLTISAHTLKAVEGAPLGLRRRLWLQVQSRIHSKSGRSVGLAISRANTPVATMNAIVQMIVPPPKFQVDELVPDVEMVSALQLDRLVVIERGALDFRQLDTEAAFEILSENTEDAYGFPPYPLIAHALANGEADLERQIRRRVVTNLEASLFRTPDRAWFERLPDLAAGRSERDAVLVLADGGDAEIDLTQPPAPALPSREIVGVETAFAEPTPSARPGAAAFGFMPPSSSGPA
jgi:putative flippase GtrA